MATEESSSCPICLESLFATSNGPRPSAPHGTGTTDTTGSTSTGSAAKEAVAAIGSAVPCGHCLHVHCWDEWMAASMMNRTTSSSNSARSHSTKCPMCNSATTAFVRLFLNVPTGTNPMMMEDSEEDISIGSEEEEEEEEEAVVSGSMNDRKPASQNSSGCSRKEPPAPAPPSSIIDLIFCDDDDDGDTVDLSRTVTTPEIVTIDDDPTYDTTTHHHSSATTITHSQKNKKTGNSNTSSLQKYRRKIRTLQQQKKALQMQYQTHVEQCRAVQVTLATKNEEYHDLAQKYETLEKTQHGTQLRLDHIMLERVRLQNQIDRLEYELEEQTTLVETKHSELQKLHYQHAKQMKELKDKKHCNMSEIQTILHERPKLLEQVRTLKEQLQHVQYQQRSAVLSSVLPAPNSESTTQTSSFVTTTTTTHKQRKELLRTISAGIDRPKDIRINAPAAAAAASTRVTEWTDPSGNTTTTAAHRIVRVSETGQGNCSSSRGIMMVKKSSSSSSSSRSKHQLLQPPPPPKKVSRRTVSEEDKRMEWLAAPASLASTVHDDNRMISSAYDRRQRPRTSFHHHDENDENREPQLRHKRRDPGDTKWGRDDKKRPPEQLRNPSVMQYPSAISLATKTIQPQVIKKRQTTLVFDRK